MRSLKLFFYLYIILVPTFQVLVCGSLKLYTWILFVSIIVVLTLLKAKKIFFNKSEIAIILSVFAINIFCVLFLGKHLFYIKFSYVIILSIFLAKIFAEYFSLDELISFVTKIYMIVISILVLEYIAYILGFHGVISGALVCEISSITQYKTLTNNFSNIFGIGEQVRGLNFPFMGPQIASQMSAISFLWFLIIWSSDRNKYSHLFYWAALSLTLLVISPTATIITALLLVVGFTSIAYLRYSHFHSTNLVNIKSFFAALLIIVLGVYLVIEYAFIRYDNLGEVVKSIVLEQFNIIDRITIIEVLFGVGMENLSYYIDGSPTEIGFISQMFRMGIIGFLVFVVFLLYVVKPLAGIIEIIFIQKKYYILASATTLLIHLLSYIHYAVIFHDGVMELFIINLSLLLFFLKKYRY